MANKKGTSGNNTLNGTNSADTLSGLAGNDVLNGKNGNDVLKGGQGKDTLNGGEGNDRLYGGGTSSADAKDNSNDLLKGGAGNDFYYRSKGDDTINDTSGEEDALFFRLNSDQIGDATWTALDRNNNENYDALRIDINGHTITILNYFDDESSDLEELNSGSGQIESFLTTDDVEFGFEDVLEFVQPPA